MNNKDRTARLRKTIEEQKLQIEMRQGFVTVLSTWAAKEEELSQLLRGVLMEKEFTEGVTSDEILKNVASFLDHFDEQRKAFDAALFREKYKWEKVYAKRRSK